MCKLAQAPDHGLVVVAVALELEARSPFELVQHFEQALLVALLLV